MCGMSSEDTGVSSEMETADVVSIDALDRAKILARSSDREGVGSTSLNFSISRLLGSSGNTNGSNGIRRRHHHHRHSSDEEDEYRRRSRSPTSSPNYHPSPKVS